MTTIDDLLAALEAIPKEEDFSVALHDLTEVWQARGVGLNGVVTILRFIEAYPDLDYGMPGALVHFAELFHRKGYEALLLQSFDRKPTALTAWMLHRILNGTHDVVERDTYLAALTRAAADPNVDRKSREAIAHFL